jgi:hypothetical protein
MFPPMREGGKNIPFRRERPRGRHSESSVFKLKSALCSNIPAKGHTQ